jgi:tripartite-type tricarboxylate transporter receptor subunit TctC
VAHPSFPADTLADLIDLARKEPGKLSYASAGPGTAQHLSMELFKLRAKLDIVHVPYKGSGPAMADLLGGHVKLMMDSTTSALAPIVDRRIKALAVTTARRAAPPLDGIPPIADTLPGFDAAGWSGLAAPARTPLEIVAKVNRDVQALLKHPDVVRQIEQRAALPAPGSPIQFAEFIKKEMDTWGEVVRATGTKPGT